MARVNILSSEEIESIRKWLQLPSLEIFLKSEWGSHIENHSQAIHEALKNWNSDSSAASISHCPGMGGFIATSRKPGETLQLGFDIEETDRVTAAIARRVCQQEDEFQKAPSPASLWSAKEAAFKSLKGPRQPAVVSEIVIGNWQKIDSQFETVSAAKGPIETSPRMQGLVLKKSQFTLAFFVHRT